MDPAKRGFLIKFRNVAFLSVAAKLLWKIMGKSALADEMVIDISDLHPGDTKTVLWGSTPIFIRRRTPQEIELAQNTDVSKLKHQEKDSDRVKDPEWLVLIGVCTHLGCVPLGNAQGWVCPCHSSYYDISGRVLKGPARKNMAVPPYRLIDGGHAIAIG